MTKTPEGKPLSPSNEVFEINAQRAHIQLKFGHQLSTQNLHHWILLSTDKNETNAIGKCLIPSTLQANVSVSPLEVLGIVRCGSSADRPTPCLTAICDAIHLTYLL